jgi:DNA-binding CsgD family transcriptional regulator
MHMESLFEIIKKRSAPGIMIFDMQGNLQYFNEESGNMVPSLKAIQKTKKKKDEHIPKAILELCRRVKDPEKGQNLSGEEMNYGLLTNEFGPPCSLRAFCIGHRPEEGQPTHIMVLLERVIEKHRTDYARIKDEFGLTKREIDVLMHICNGLTNREISEDLGISEYTVKDHIKNLMRKMNAGSRSEIISRTIQR